MQKVQPYAGSPTVLVLLQAAVVLNPTTTILLQLMDKDWRQAIHEDHNLSRIVQATKDNPLGSLTNAKLVE
jgi:hypothetical protein